MEKTLTLFHLKNSKKYMTLSPILLGDFVNIYTEI
jgi:hypothetical protein